MRCPARRSPDGAAISRKPTNHCQPVGPLGRLCLSRLHCPSQGDLGGDAGGTGSFGKSNKPLQQPPGETQLMAEGATSGQVLVERVL